jgi:hypothetical protein
LRRRALVITPPHIGNGIAWQVVFQAVSKHGWNLEHASPDLRKDPVIVLAAVQNNGWAFQWADDVLKYDKQSPP